VPLFTFDKEEIASKSDGRILLKNDYGIETSRSEADRPVTVAAVP